MTTRDDQSAAVLMRHLAPHVDTQKLGQLRAEVGREHARAVKAEIALKDAQADLLALQRDFERFKRHAKNDWLAEQASQRADAYVRKVTGDAPVRADLIGQFPFSKPAPALRDVQERIETWLEPVRRKARPFRSLSKP